MNHIVLVIEDDPDSREWLVEALRAEGYEVHGAKNGADGLMQLGSIEGQASLILLDMMMPAMSGWDVLAALARFHPRPPVVVITAANVHGVPAGAEAVLTKPLHVDEVLEAVRRHRLASASLPVARPRS